MEKLAVYWSTAQNGTTDMPKLFIDHKTKFYKQ